MLGLFRTIQTVLVHVIAEQLDRYFHHRHSTHLPPLSHKTYLRRGIQPYVSDRKIYQLLNSSPGIVEHAEQNRISAAIATAQVWLRKDRGQAFFRKILDILMRMFANGNGKYPLALKHMIGLFRLNVSEKRMQGSKTMVTGAKRTVPLLAEVIQERLDQGNINLLDLQPFQRDFPNVTAKPQKERKHITICLDGVRAGVPLRNQVMRQESRYMNGQLGRLHASALPGITSPKAASTRLITSGKSSAVKWRYRCVPDTFWCPR